MKVLGNGGAQVREYGFFVVALDGDEHDEMGEVEYRGRFSITVPSSSGTAGFGRWAVVVRRDEDGLKITHIGFARSTGSVSTFDRRVTVEPLMALGEPLDLEPLGRHMTSHHYDALLRAASGRGAELTAPASRDLRRALSRWVSDSLWESMRPPQRRTTGVDTLHAQYDALATGFGIAGFEPEVLRDRTYGAEYSVLEMIRSSPTEPDLIARDLQHFAWTRSNAVREHVQRFEQRGRVVDVVNLNATPEEGATGVDLLYYNHAFESFIGVQYKLADARGDRLGRIDARMKSQIARMLLAEKIARHPAAPLEHRLGGSSMMFLKFARPAEVGVQVSGMAKGWYVPAAYADALISSGSAVGAKGGATFTLANLDRWLGNEAFTHLAREGWIGSIGVDQDALRTYIDAALAERRSVMLMESSAAE